ncbi:unnamed protein product [Mytilus coruscus]|uniref:C-type lectin domain-containing protein n=1 Tax=Mytilus coruscus TaxID=42192 RepID=A0A6J7ZTH0_MYTCO|nr:unnamed protein product [Mytilus coruscus]
MWFLTGSNNSLRDCRRYIPIHELSKSLSPLLANILPAVHALTGCDSTSAIFGFGKKTVFKLIRKSPSKFTNLQNFDKIDFFTSLSAARELISSLYDPKDKFASSHVDLNKLRVKLATCKDTSLFAKNGILKYEWPSGNTTTSNQYDQWDLGYPRQPNIIGKGSCVCLRGESKTWIDHRNKVCKAAKLAFICEFR